MERIGIFEEEIPKEREKSFGRRNGARKTTDLSVREAGTRKRVVLNVSFFAVKGPQQNLSDQKSREHPKKGQVGESSLRCGPSG